MRCRFRNSIIELIKKRLKFNNIWHTKPIQQENIQHIQNSIGFWRWIVVTNFITSFLNGTQTRIFLLYGWRNDNNDKREDEFTESVNLRNPGEFTILEFGKKVIDKTNSDSQIIHCHSTCQSNTKSDITLAKKAKLGTEIMFNEGLDKTMEYYMQLFNTYWKKRFTIP